jgi:hypothetical protein
MRGRVLEIEADAKRRRAMRMKGWSASGLLLALLSAGMAKGDVWDVGPANDNTAVGTQNELLQGSDQFHDLAAQPPGVADLDWFRLGQKPYSSYEIVLDSTSASIGPGLLLERVASDTSTVLQTAVPITSSLGFSQSLRWENGTASAVDNQYIRIQSNGCTSTCTANDVYRIRAYETTYSIPRFNNSGTQTTVVLVQNPTASSISGGAYFWSGTGTLLATQTFTLPAKQLLGINTAAIPALSGQSGSVTISHNGRYGSLSGKAVSLEPATGYSFDTAMLPVPN